MVSSSGAARRPSALHHPPCWYLYCHKLQQPKRSHVNVSREQYFPTMLAGTPRLRRQS